MRGRDVALAGLALYTLAGIATVVSVRSKQAAVKASLPAGAVVVPPTHPLLAEAYVAAIWPLVLLDPFKK